MTVLVIFGSRSDVETYQTIVEGLNAGHIGYKLRVSSAHKTPDVVQEILKGEYDVIVAGAGLAAHLPGVIAAKKTVPVLGVPCPGAYGGLDAFLSIVQMPPGIPVLQVNAKNAADEVAKILNIKDRVVVVGEGKAAERATKTLDMLDIPYTKGPVQDDAVNIVVKNLGQAVEKRSELIVYCPEGESKAEDAVKAQKAAQYGLWVGVNRGENAAVAVAEILGKGDAIKSYRGQLAEKIMRADAEVRE